MHATKKETIITKSVLASQGVISYLLALQSDAHRIAHTIPDNCHFVYTDAIFGAKILYPNARLSGQIGFRDKIA